jgi:hypothetical protein
VLACFVPVRLVVLAYASYGAWRARFAPALVLVISLLATVMLLWIVLAPPSVVGELPVQWFWAPTLVATAVSAPVAWRAFAALDVEPAVSPRHPVLETAAYALLGNALLDAAQLVVVGLAALLMASDG